MSWPHHVQPNTVPADRRWGSKQTCCTPIKPVCGVFYAPLHHVQLCCWFPFFVLDWLSRVYAHSSFLNVTVWHKPGVTGGLPACLPAGPRWTQSFRGNPGSGNHHHGIWLPSASFRPKAAHEAPGSREHSEGFSGNHFCKIVQNGFNRNHFFLEQR